MRSALSGVPDFWDPLLGLSGNRRQGSHHADNERAATGSVDPNAYAHISVDTDDLWCWGSSPAGLITLAVVWGLVELLVAAVAGAWLYQEAPRPVSAKA